MHTGALISLTGSRQGGETFRQLQQGTTAAGDDSLLHGGAGGIEGILNPQLAVFELGFRGSPHLDHRHATGQLGDPLLQLLAVVIGVGVVELALDRGHAIANGGLVIAVGHDRGAVLGDRDAPGLPQLGEPGFLQAHGLVFTHHGAAGEDRDIGQHGLAAIAKAWRPHSRHLQHAAVLVYHQGGQGFAVHLLGQNQQRPAALRHRFEHGHQVGDGADLAVGDQDQGVFKDALTALLIGDEIGGAVAPIEGHPLGDFQLGGQGGRLLHSDHPVGANLGHGLGDHPTDLVVVAGAHGGHLTDGIATHRLGALSDPRDDVGRRFFHAAAQAYGAGPGRHVFQTFAHQGLGQKGGGGGAIAGSVLGFAGHLLHQLGADVFEWILEFDLLGDGDAVIDDVGSAEFFLQHHVAATGADGHLHRVGQGIDTPLQGAAGGIREADQLGHDNGTDSVGFRVPQRPAASEVVRGGESRIAASPWAAEPLQAR